MPSRLVPGIFVEPALAGGGQVLAHRLLVPMSPFEVLERYLTLDPLYYKLSTFKPDAQYSVRGVGPAARGLWLERYASETQETWDSRPFVDVLASVIATIRDALHRHQPAIPDEDWIERMCARVPHVEHTINAGLLYGLSQLRPERLGELVGHLVSDTEATLRVCAGGFEAERAHIMQLDGVLAGMESVVLVEMKSRGLHRAKSVRREHRFDLAQVVKYVDLVRFLELSPSTRLTLLLVGPRGEVDVVAQDLKSIWAGLLSGADGAGRELSTAGLEIRERLGLDERTMMATMGRMKFAEASFEDIVEGLKGMSPRASEEHVLSTLSLVASNAARPSGRCTL